jgi:hypothetical protein
MSRLHFNTYPSHFSFIFFCQFSLFRRLFDSVTKGITTKRIMTERLKDRTYNSHLALPLSFSESFSLCLFLYLSLSFSLSLSLSLSLPPSLSLSIISLPCFFGPNKSTSSLHVFPWHICAFLSFRGHACIFVFT